MNKNLRYLILFIAVLLAFFLVFRERSPFGKGNISFAVDPGKEITRIELHEASKKLILRKSGDEWLVNDNAAAEISSISYIIKVIEGLKIKSPVSEELFNEEISSRGVVPVRVKVYSRNKLIRSFYVYRTKSNVYGNIMKTRERSKPFIVHIPGIEEDIGSAFSTNELSWQTYTVFSVMPSEIRSVSLRNFTDTLQSFSINKNNSRYTLQDQTGEMTGWDTTRVARYLSYFIRIPFERWAFEETEESVELRAGEHLYRITLTKTGGTIKTLDIFERRMGVNGDEKSDTDRVYGKSEESDELFIMRYFDIDPVLKRKTYFFAGS